MRESKLLLIKNIVPEPIKKGNQLNQLSSLVEYSPKMKSAVIGAHNISLSPSKKKAEKKKVAEKAQVTTQYRQPEELQKVDFVKLFIVEELLYYISKSVISSISQNERIKE